MGDRRASRQGASRGLADYLGSMRAEIWDDAGPERREQMRAAERRREVFRVWNAVVGGTREGRHVTGLRYLPDTNELLVYLDGAAWTQEMTMLREIIRTRMARAGVELDGFIFKTSREGYARPGRPGPAKPRPAAPAPERRPLDDDALAALDSSLAGIDDPRLRAALKRAEQASFEYRRDAGDAQPRKRP